MGYPPPTAATCARTSRSPATPMRALRRAAIAHAGRMLTETPAIWLRPQHEVAALVREVDGHGRRAGAARARARRCCSSRRTWAASKSRRNTPRSTCRSRCSIARRRCGWLEPLMREGRGRGDVRLVPADLQRRARAVRGAEAPRGGRLSARPGAGRGRGRMGGVLRQARLYRDARAQARAARRRRLLPRLRQAPAARRGLRASWCARSRQAFRTRPRPGCSTARSRSWCANAPSSTSGATTATRRPAGAKPRPA